VIEKRLEISKIGETNAGSTNMEAIAGWDIRNEAK